MNTAYLNLVGCEHFITLYYMVFLLYEHNVILISYQHVFPV